METGKTCLTDGHIQNRRVEGLDRHKVHCNNKHGVVVNAKLEMSINGCVDDPHPIRSARCEADSESASLVAIDVSAVNQAVVQCRWARLLCGQVQLINSLVAPIVEEDVSKVLVVVRTRRPVDQNTAEDTFPCLQGKVGMVPRRPVLGRSPGVRRSIARCGGALRDGGDAVVRVGEVLANAVEVNA